MTDQADQALISEKVLAAIRSIAPLDVEYDNLPTKGLPILSMQTLTGTPVVKRYKNGSYIGNYRFALYLRQNAQDNAKRIDATKKLSDLADQIENLDIVLGETVAFWHIEQDTLPVKVAGDEAYDDNQVTFTLVYKKG